MNQRLWSLDVFRGLTIALMIVVNSPGNATPYTWLQHAMWNGCTLADVIFPFFIVIVGVSSVLALTYLKSMGYSTRSLVKKIIRRSGYIFLMGLLLNFIPHMDLETVRILGVLQRIAICYFVSALLFLTTRIQTQVFIIVGLLVGYSLFLFYTPSTLDSNLVGVVDKFLFTSAHLYLPHFDPEGLLSTLPAIASVLLGNVLGFVLISSKTPQQKCRWMSGMGLVLIALGCFGGMYLLPINKPLWSSTYACLTAGMAYLVYFVLYILIEIRRWVRWSAPLALLGRHAMLAYMLHVLFLKVQALIPMHNSAGMTVNFRIYITEVLFSQLSLENAALGYAASYMLFWFVVIVCVEQGQRLYRRVN